MLTQDLDENTRLLLETLPDGDDGAPHRRQQALTRKDGEWIVRVMKIAMSNQGCSIGLDARQIAAIKGTPAHTFEAMNEIVKERRRILATIGLITVTIIGWIAKVVFEAVDWHRVGASLASYFKGH